jgi:hypothetical protein
MKAMIIILALGASQLGAVEARISNHSGGTVSVTSAAGVWILDQSTEGRFDVGESGYLTIGNGTGTVVSLDLSTFSDVTGNRADVEVSTNVLGGVQGQVEQRFTERGYVWLGFCTAFAWAIFGTSLRFIRGITKQSPEL